jgi:ParB-like chromosome segregation protein Spo0J
MLANTLSVGLDMDRAQVEAALQGANERDITTMMEQLSAGDTEFNQQRVAANLQLARQQSANQSQTLQFNDGQQQQALSMNRQQQDINARMADNNRTSLETTQRADYMLQQESNADTANSVNASLQQQQRSAKGASLLDYLGTGLTGYNAVAPLFKKEKEQVPEYKKLGGPNAYMPQQGPNAYMPPQYGNKSGEYTSQTGAA